jgi:hypothetical protein
MVYEESALVHTQLIVPVRGAGLPTTAYVQDAKRQANCVICRVFIVTCVGLGEMTKTKNITARKCLHM